MVEKDTLEARLTELEIRNSYQEKLIHDLDSVVSELGGRVVSLERVIKELRDTLKSGELPVGSADEPPPHY